MVRARSQTRLALNRSAQRRASFLVGRRWPRAPAYALAAPQPRRSPRAVSGYRTPPPGARTLPSRAVGRLVPFGSQGRISTLAVIPRFWGALRPAGTPLPNVRASLRKKGAAPRPKTNASSTTRFRKRFSPDCEAGPVTSRDSALPAKTRPPQSRRPSSGYGSQFLANLCLQMSATQRLFWGPDFAN
jgi:hypothetical protein